MESNNTIRINTCKRAHVVQTHKYMDTVGQRESIVPQRWHAVTGGLCVAAAQRGPAGPCMQLCGRNAPALALAGFWTSSTCGQLDGSALASLYQQIQRTPAERGCVEILDTVFFFLLLLFWSKPRANPFLFLLGVLCMLKTSDLNGLTSKEDCWWFVRCLFFLHSNILMWENGSLVALIWYGKCHCLR